MADAKEIFKDKRVIIGGAVALLVLGGAGAFFVINQNNAGGGADQAATPAAPAAPAGGGPTAAGAPAAPAAGGTPAAPGSPTAGKVAAAQAGKAGPVRQTVTSFADAPASWGGGGGAAGAGTAPPAGGGAAAGAGAGGGALDSLQPIQRGIRQKVRPDPFISFYLQRYELPPAYSIAVPIRLAAAAKPKERPVTTLEPVDLLGPLPPVERRVAGVLTDGSVSAILETGTPGGAGTDVRVIQPGQTVPSGIPGIDDLTVASITPTRIELRANDGRTVNVALSNVPAAYADAFRTAVSGAGPGGGLGGPPPGAFGPGGGPPRPGAVGSAIN